MASTPLTLISSMATRQLLAELAAAYRQAAGVEVRVESVGGVEASRRVQAGEAFDLVVLAEDALAALAEAGRLQASSRRALVDSAVEIAVHEDAPRPAIDSEAALRQTLLDARAIGYSTGPSGNALLRLIERWGLAETLEPRLVQARPGVPVGSLVASGEVEIGFQQRSELIGLPGIALLGGMPAGLEIVTTFAGAVGTASSHPEAARALLDFCCEPRHAALKQRLGLDAPRHA